MTKKNAKPAAVPTTATPAPAPVAMAVPVSTTGTTIPGYAEYELDIIKALHDYLPPIIDTVAHVPLTAENISRLPAQAQGVYVLLESGVPMYVGKTDSEHGFRDRLARHFFTLSARKNLSIGAVSFKAVRIMVFTVVDVESTMIDHYTKGNKDSWQNTGFGSNDPGHRRENQRASRFDKEHPVDIDLPLSLPAGAKNLLELLIDLKDGLPFDFRYETDSFINAKGEKDYVHYTKGHADQRGATVSIPKGGMTLREVLRDVIVPGLPDGWVVTVFPGRVILYKEPTTYPEQLEQIKK